MTHGFGLEYPGLFAARRPVQATVLLFIVLAASALSLPFLSFDDDINRVFLSQSEKSQEYRKFQKKIGSEPSDFVILIEADTPFKLQDFERMRDLALEIELSDSIVSVLSPFSARFSKQHPDFPDEPVFKADLEEDEIKRRLTDFRASKGFFRRLISTDDRSALIVATAKLDDSRTRSRNVLAELQQLTKGDTNTNLRFTVTGERAISIAIVDALKVDLLRLNLFGSALVVVFAFLVFRSLRTVMVAVLPALFGMLVSLSLFAVLGYPITVLSNVIPILVLVLGVADCMHLTKHFQDHADGDSATERITATIREVGPACALTALTTAVAFMAIAISDNDQLFEFAVLGALGVMVSYITVIISFALLARFFGAVMPTNTALVKWLGVPAAVQKGVFYHDRKIIFVSALIFVVGLYAYSRTEPWFLLQQNLPSNSELGAANDRLVDRFGGFFRVWAELETAGLNSLETTTGWARLTNLTASIKAAAPDYPVVSLATIALWQGTPNRAPSDEQMSEIPANLMEQLITSDGKLARVIVFVPEPMRDHTALQVHDRIEQAASSAGAARVTGLPVIMRHESVAIIEQLGLGLLIACLVAVIVIAFAFQWPALAVVLILPNVLPLLLTAAALHILNNGQLNPTAVLALTIAFGIAIDDSIHFVSRYRLNRIRGHDVDAALKTAINQIGCVMILTTLLLSAGLLVTLTSTFSNVRLFGTMLVLTFVTALLADLLLLPALLRQKWLLR